MLECQPNLDGISNREFKSIVDRYELIFNTLSNATNGNFIVRLKTNAIPRLPFRDLVLWWSEVLNEFQPSDAQIKLLNDEYVACVQKPGQTGTKYLREVEGKADSLKKLGKFYSNEDIGKKVYDGLNLTLKQFVWTNCMAQKITCDLSSVNTFLKTFEDMEATIQFNHNQFTPMTANATIIRGKSARNIYTSSNNNNNMTTGKKVEEFDGSRNIHRDNSFNDTRVSLNEQKNQSSFEVSGDTVDSDINSTLNSEVTMTDTEILKNLNIENAVKNMKYFKKLVRQYSRASGKSNEETNSTSNTTGEDVVVLPHSKNNATGVQRSRSSPTSIGQQSTSSSIDHYNKKGRFDRSITVNNSDKSYNILSPQRNPSQNFDRHERSKSTNRDHRVNRSDSRDRYDGRNARSDKFRRDGDRNFGNTNQSRFSYFLLFSSNSMSGITCVKLTTTLNKHLVRSFESLIHLITIYNESYNKIIFNLDALRKENINNNEEEILRNLKYYSSQGFSQPSRVACNMMSDESTGTFMDTRTDESGAFIYNTSFPDDDPEILIIKDTYETIPQNTTPSLVSSSSHISGPSSYVFGVSGKMKFAPQNQLAQLRRSAKDGLVKKIVQAVCKEETKDLDDVPDNDNGEELHPIYSRILQSGHKAAKKVYQEIGKDFMPSQLGYTPVQVLSTCLRWPTEVDDVIED
jgi:hypothetical protein